MICRAIKSSDYATACEWWDGHNTPRVSEEALPSTGVVVEGYCLGWVYVTNEGFAFTSFLVGNPDKKGVTAFNALRLTLKGLISVAEKHGCSKIFASVKNVALIKAMENVGYVKAGEGVTELIYYKRR